MTKTVYIYDAATGEYKHPYEAQESPAEPGVYIEPIASTPDAPPSLGDNEAAQRNADNTDWVIIPDFRGKIAYDQQKGQPVEIKDVGSLPGGYALTLPPPTLGELRAKQVASLLPFYNAAIQTSVSYMGADFQADLDSQMVLTKTLSAGGVPSGFFWVAEDNTRVPMTYGEFQGLAGAMLVQGQAAFEKLRDYKDQIYSATTASKISKIVWQ